MRALGVDFGEKRIGLAISDPEGRVAVPLETMLALERPRGRRRRSPRWRAARGSSGWCVGEPVRLDGSRGEAAERARRFGERLAAATGLPLELVGEALTSVEAEPPAASRPASTRGAIRPGSTPWPPRSSSRRRSTAPGGPR